MATSRGAFVDNKGVRWDTNDADFEGMLAKKSRWMGEWRQRYMLLKGSKLFFATNATAAPHGMIDLVDCLSVKSADAKTGKQYAMEITLRSEAVLLTGKTERVRDEWLGQIGRAIVNHSSMFVEHGADDGDDGDDGTQEGVE